MPIYTIRSSLQYPVVSLPGVLDYSTKRSPDKALVISGETGTSLTYREVSEMSNGFASSLVDLGVKKGDRVALFMPNRPEYVVSTYGTMKAGAVVTPINSMFKEREVEYQMNDSGAKIIVVDEVLYPIVKAVKDRLQSVKHVLVVDKHIENEHTYSDLALKKSQPPSGIDVNPSDDLAALPYSSGTTGLPKGVMLTHYNIVSNIIQGLFCIPTGPNQAALAFLPFFHIYGSTVLMHAPIYVGSTIVTMRRFDLQLCLDLITKYRVKRWFVVPPILVAVLRNIGLVKKYDLSSLEFILSGAAPQPPEVAKSVTQLLGVPVIQGYGLTETSPVINTLAPLGLTKYKVESVGPPCPDTEEKIVDLETGLKELPPGQIGELIVKGPQVMKGYWKRPSETADILRDGWLYTGDIAYMDEEGYFYVVDRKKELIKYKGYQVPPAELEAVLLEHEGVAMAAVIGKPDEEAGEVPKAFVVVKPGYEDKVTAEALITFVGDKVAPYKKIREVEFVKEIPISPSGKILRRMLIEREREKRVAIPAQ